MQDNFSFGVNYTTTIEKENVGSILFDVDVLKNDGSGGREVAPISDLNKVSIDLTYLPKFSAKPIQIFSGYLNDLLIALYAQDPRYDVWTKKYASGYKIKLSFDALPFTLMNGDKLKIDCNFNPDAFTGTLKSESSITIETLQSVKKNNLGFIPLIETFAITQGKENITETLGNKVQGITLVTDYVNTYDASTNAKVQTIDLQSKHYNKSTTQNALIAENLEMLAINPDTNMRNLVLYSDPAFLDDVTLKAKFDKGVANGTKLIVTKIQDIH